MPKYNTYDRMRGKKIGFWWLVIALITFYTLIIFSFKYVISIENKDSQNIKREK